MRRALVMFGIAAPLVFASAGRSFGREPAQDRRPAGLVSRGSCETLTSLNVPGATITLARLIDAGAFSPPGTAGAAPVSEQPFAALPAFCRIAATLRPSSDSDIKIEVWMPARDWNGKLQAVGNGAFNGAIAYPAMATALGRGYAAASTDTGHVGNGASFALDHPEKVIDFGWRAVHEMTVTSKKIISAFYDAPPKYSYWNGCSAGGRQGMKAAQRFPEDFNGIIAGAPGLDWTGRAAQALRVAQALERDEAARLSPVNTRVLHSAVLAACDSLDGVKDGVVDDPARCAFDPGVLECKGADAAACLTSAQVKTARMLYADQVNPQTKREITGLAPGSETGWTELGWSASARATGLDQFRFLVFKDPQWTVDKFNFPRDIVRAEEIDGDTINALAPSLEGFIRHGGKLIQYHGWSDPQISPRNSTQYYRRVTEAMGGPDQVHDHYRLFMVPGMAHCGGGDGPNTFDMVTALEQWVEQGKAPDRVVASRRTNQGGSRTRPLCPYPLVAQYHGAGSTDDAAHFDCAKR